MLIYLAKYFFYVLGKVFVNSFKVSIVKKIVAEVFYLIVFYAENNVFTMAQKIK